MKAFVTNALARLGHFAILTCTRIAGFTKSAQPVEWALALARILINFAVLARRNLGAHAVRIHLGLAAQSFSQATHLIRALQSYFSLAWFPVKLVRALVLCIRAR